MNTSRTTYPGQRLASRAAGRCPLALALLLSLCGAAAAQGQSSEQQDEVGPPPLVYLPEEARQRLAAAKNMKDRTRLSLALCEERLASASAHAAADRYEAATADLGVYEAIVKDAIRSVHNTGPTTNKQRDLFKRIEMALRAHTTRLETIRRGLPAQNGVHVQATIDFLRGARAEALDAFFDNTVIRERPPAARSPEGVRAGGTAAAASAKENSPQRP